jgi:hypothetical protein
MLRKSLMVLSVVGVLAAPATAFACISFQISFDSYVEMATDALRSKKLEPAAREQVERLLVSARGDKGPRWLGERQHALDAVMELLGLPKTTPLFDELTPKQQEAQLRESVTEILASIDRDLPTAQLADANLAKLKELRRQVAELVAAGKWAEARSRGTEALGALGAVFPAKC